MHFYNALKFVNASAILMHCITITLTIQPLSDTVALLALFVNDSMLDRTLVVATARQVVYHGLANSVKHRVGDRVGIRNKVREWLN